MVVGGVLSAELNLAYTTYTASSSPSMNRCVSPSISRCASSAPGLSPMSATEVCSVSLAKRKNWIPFFPAACSSASAPSARSRASRSRASRIRLALKAPASPRLLVMSSTAARRTCAGWRSSG